MSVLTPPEQAFPDELEALIREARARQRKRRLGAAAVVALLAGGVVAAYSIAGGGSPRAARSSGGIGPAVRSGKACGIRVDARRIVGAGGQTLYREPGNWTPGYPHPSVVRCSGPSVWVVWDNGAASNQEGYVGAHSRDGGRTWRLVFAEAYFGVAAPHELDSYLGPWTLVGNVAYFTGSCPVCSNGTVSLSVTKDGGRTFSEYKVPALDGFAPSGIRVSGHDVTIRGTRLARGVAPRKTVTIHIA